MRRYTNPNAAPPSKQSRRGDARLAQESASPVAPDNAPLKKFQKTAREKGLQIVLIRPPPVAQAVRGEQWGLPSPNLRKRSAAVAGFTDGEREPVRRRQDAAPAGSRPSGSRETVHPRVSHNEQHEASLDSADITAAWILVQMRHGVYEGHRG